jgi:hypothetical protein
VLAKVETSRQSKGHPNAAYVINSLKNPTKITVIIHANLLIGWCGAIVNYPSLGCSLGETTKSKKTCLGREKTKLGLLSNPRQTTC